MFKDAKNDYGCTKNLSNKLNKTLENQIDQIRIREQLINLDLRFY